MSDYAEREAIRRIVANGRGRVVAAELLGVVSDRFLLLVEPVGDAPPHHVSDAIRERLPDYALASFRKMTGVMNRTGVEQWRAAWALPVMTVDELASWSKTFRARGCRIKAWDTLERFAVGAGDEMMWNWEFDDIEAGWREQRDGPLELFPGHARIGVAGENFYGNRQTDPTLHLRDAD